MNTLKALNSICNAYLALFMYMLSKRKKDIWLIGGHAGNLYTDNAKAFYEYILNTYPNINIYWIVNKNAPDIYKIKGKKLIKGSIKSYYYFYHSKVTLFSDTLNSDIAPFTFLLPIVRIFYKRQLKVYLGHGTISFKKIPIFSGIKQKIKTNIFRSYNLAIASTELEIKVMEKNYGIKKSAIVLAGSARNDLLTDAINSTDTILIAPTWRPWLKESKTFKDTDFFHFYKILLTNKKLYNYLVAHNIFIRFYLHHMFHKYIDEFILLENKYINILPSNADITLEIRSSRMLITDYSSICSDFYYLKKPVLFYQFDKEKYIKNIGSEINLDNNDFGEVFYTIDNLINYIIHTVDNNYLISKKQIFGNKYFLKFNDKDNCKRIFNSIKSKK